ncbi:heavy-metal-associated domain-containing protein [Rhodococcoides kroppenstedtii]|uniref:heavy-metal-associated domain-containing protein n=1 Tax=Rhodococcoides kroppenstedtii TaxID=293050 RepID=UPI0028F037CD|nr:copper ion binding protein [Rhodococcus kroppenstedtii]
MTTTSITVTGMTCQHCVNAVTEEVGALDGVTGVTVDLATGRVDVESAAPMPADALAAAVDEAGYEIAPS